jgi:hypothetical protein
MRAAVIRAPGGTPILEQFADPQLGPGLSVGTLGPASTISASALRNKLVTLVGQGMVGTPAEVRRSAYAELMRHALDGKLTLDLGQTRLDDISETWGLLKAGPRCKLVVKPLPVGPLVQVNHPHSAMSAHLAEGKPSAVTLVQPIGFRLGTGRGKE